MTSINGFKSLRRWIQIGCIILFIVVIGYGVPQPSLALGLNFGQSSQTATVQESDQSSYGLCMNQAEKIDLNNANIIAFQDCPGFYPQLASLIVQNSPYNNLDEVLSIEELSDTQKATLKDNLESFKLSEPITSLEMRMPPRPSMRSNP